MYRGLWWGVRVWGVGFRFQGLRSRAWGLERQEATVFRACRGTSLARECTPLGPYRRPMPRVLKGS